MTTATAPAPAQPVTLPMRPVHRDDLEVTRNDGAEFAVVYNPATSKYLRVGNVEADILLSLNGQRSLNDLADGADLGDSNVIALVARFQSLNLLADDGGKPAPAQARRRVPRLRSITFIEMWAMNPERWLERASGPIKLAMGPWGRWLAVVAIIVAGVAATVSHPAPLVVPQSAAERIAVWLALSVGLSFVMVAHEFCHAAMVVYHGGRVRRMGLVLLYLRPALFCDVSDSWRFASRWQRFEVAAAGIGFHIVIGSVSLTFASLVSAPGVASAATLFAGVNGGLALMNLIPFVKLDGYWMLVSAVDKPNLRSDAFAHLVGTVERIAGLPAPAPRRRAWAWLLFAAVSAVTTVAVIGFALWSMQRWVEPLGVTGDALFLAFLAYVAWWCGVAIATYVRALRLRLVGTAQ